MTADPEVMRHIGPPLSRPDAWRQMAMHAGQWALRGYGSWAIERASDGMLLGRAGLWNPEGWPGIEVGWMLRRDAWGHGYASEAARAAVAWAWAAVDTGELISIIRPENARSVRVAEGLGMQRARREVLNSIEADIYSLGRSTPLRDE